MRIAVLGATGSIGGAILAEALGRGHDVVAAVRDPSRARELGAAEVVQIDARDEQALGELAERVDVLVSALGGGASGEPRLVADIAPGLVRAVGPHARLFVVGGAGSLRHPDGGRVVDHPDFPEAWRGGSLAQVEALETLRASGDAADWTYLSPADVIEPGERTGGYRTGEDDLVVDGQGVSRISIADYAVAVLDELETPRFRGRRFTVAY